MRACSGRFALPACVVACVLGAPLGGFAQLVAPPAPVAAAGTMVVPTASGMPWTPPERAALNTDLEALLTRSPALHGAHVGAIVLDTRSGTVLYAHGADDAFQPASTLKLLVGSVALERLGPAYRFHTQAVVHDGRLLVRAGGDPTLARGDFRSLAAALLAGGVAPLDDIAVDDTHFDRVPYPAGWTWDDFGYDYAAPLSAATIDENVASFTVVPGANVGDGVQVTDGKQPLGSPLDCNSGTAPLRSVATTVGADGPSTIDTRTVTPACTEIFGTVPIGKSASIDVAVHDPRVHFVETLRRTLFATDAGAMPGNRMPAGTAVAAVSDAPLWTHDSPELRVTLGPRFWIPSDNLFAELLLKELGFATVSAPGTTDKGIAAEKLWLRSIGVDPGVVTLADGCGMSQYDRVTPRVLAAILQHDWNGPNRQLVLDSLPVGGARGTIEGMPGTVAAGRVFAKTGSMQHVRGLAGYLAPRRHGAVTFAFNVDDWTGDAAALSAVRANFAARIIAD